MDRGAWWAVVRGVAEPDTAEPAEHSAVSREPGCQGLSRWRASLAGIRAYGLHTRLADKLLVPSLRSPP